ncbi:MAG: Uma2 family endonuclease [Cytophagales bacterium]|nr:Uma2 family endonuclease [Armatimonadota bacterium]
MNIALDLGPNLSPDPALQMRLRVPALSDTELFEICQRNKDWRFEREPSGELLIRPFLGTVAGLQMAELTLQIGNWTKTHGGGLTFGPGTGMRLPNGAVRSPSASWLSLPRWQALKSEQRGGFLPVCADFVTEIVSPFDDRSELLDKMLEYRENGARLAWLIDPARRTVDVFRPREAVRTLSEITHLMERQDEAAVLPGFVLDLRRLWNAGQ